MGEPERAARKVDVDEDYDDDEVDEKKVNTNSHGPSSASGAPNAGEGKTSPAGSSVSNGASVNGLNGGMAKVEAQA